MSFIINPYLFGNPLVYTTFDGTNEEIDCGNGVDFDIEYTSPISFSFWYKGTMTTGSFMGKTSTTAQKGHSIYCASNQLYFSMVSSGVSQYVLRETVSNSYNNNTWKHIVVTYNGTLGIGNFKIYVNSVSRSIIQVSNTLTTSIISTNPFRIGRKATSYCNGSLDKLIIYDKELSAGEVTTIYNYGRKKGLIGIGNEVAQWELDTLNPIDEIGANDGTSVNMDASNIVIG